MSRVTTHAQPATAPTAREALLVALGLALLTVVITWPQAAHLTTSAHGHHDTLFNMWRLSWISHALSTTGTPLFDAPIFVPVTGTLAFSDAVLLQGVLAWPWIVAGVPVLTVYNVLQLGGMWGSALGAYVLARYLTGSRTAAFIAGVVYGFAPYRMEHAMHLELQWSQWMPLTLWALHRTWDGGRLRDGALTGVFLALQFLSCIYYGVFLVLFLVLLAPALLWCRRPAGIGRVAAALALGAVIAIPPVVAYGLPYRANQQALGGRSPDEIAHWSAQPRSYAAVPPENRLYGALLHRFGTPEGRLFPGLAALGLAAGVVVARRRTAGVLPDGGSSRRMSVVYAWGLAWAVVLSFGTHTPVYAAMLRVVPPLDGLRAPARFGMLVLLALSVLAAFGFCAWRKRLEGTSDDALSDAPARRSRRRLAAAVGVVLLLVAEYATQFGPLHPWPTEAPLYARWLGAQPRGVVIEFPVPRSNALPLHEAEWSFIGRFHGQPLANGYSGYYPRPYIELIESLVRFPSGESLRALGRRGVRYVVLHEDRYEPGDFLALLGRIDGHPCLERVGRVPDRTYPVTIYLLCDAVRDGGEERQLPAQLPAAPPDVG